MQATAHVTECWVEYHLQGLTTSAEQATFRDLAPLLHCIVAAPHTIHTPPHPPTRHCLPLLTCWLICSSLATVGRCLLLWMTRQHRPGSLGSRNATCRRANLVQLVAAP